MLAFSSPSVSKRIKNVLQKYSLPTEIVFSSDDLLSALRHDKKANAKGVNAVVVNEIGSFEFKFVDFAELDEIIKEAYIK